MKKTEKANVLAKAVEKAILKSAVISGLSYDDILEVFSDTAATEEFCNTLKLSITVTGYEKAKVEVVEGMKKNLKKRLKEVGVKLRSAERTSLQNRDWSVDFTQGEVRALYIADDITATGDINAMRRVIDGVEPIFFANVHRAVKESKMSSKTEESSAKKEEKSESPKVVVVETKVTKTEEPKATEDKTEDKKEESTTTVEVKETKKKGPIVVSAPVVSAVSESIKKEPEKKGGIKIVQVNK